MCHLSALLQVSKKHFVTFDFFVKRKIVLTVWVSKSLSKFGYCMSGLDGCLAGFAGCLAGLVDCLVGLAVHLANHLACLAGCLTGLRAH